MVDEAYRIDILLLVKTGTFARLPWIDDIELLLPKAKGGLVHVEHLRHLADGKIELEIFILFRLILLMKFNP